MLAAKAQDSMSPVPTSRVAGYRVVVHRCIHRHLQRRHWHMERAEHDGSIALALAGLATKWVVRCRRRAGTDIANLLNMM